MDQTIEYIVRAFHSVKRFRIERVNWEKGTETNVKVGGKLFATDDKKKAQGVAEYLQAKEDAKASKGAEKS